MKARRLSRARWIDAVAEMVAEKIERHDRQENDHA